MSVVNVEGPSSRRDVMTRLADDLRSALGDRVDVSVGIGVAEADTPAVLLVLLPADGEEERLGGVVADFIAHGAIVVPLVPPLMEFDFSELSDGLAPLRDFNALKWGDPAKILEAVRVALGLDAGIHDIKALISYRRSDGSAIANEVADLLSKHHFEVFKDDRSLPGGARVQQEIRERLHQMDFVLLIETPGAAESKWVEAELVMAIEMRVPVCVLVTSDMAPMHLVMNAPRFLWHEGAAAAGLPGFLRNRIGSKRSFDARVAHTVTRATAIAGLTVEQTSRTRVCVIVRGDQPQLVVAHRDGPPTLENIYQTSLLLGERTVRGANAVFVTSVEPLPSITRDAARWAGNDRGLDIATVAELVERITGLTGDVLAPEERV